MIVGYRCWFVQCLVPTIKFDVRIAIIWGSLSKVTLICVHHAAEFCDLSFNLSQTYLT